jgi:hypothetical protein
MTMRSEPEAELTPPDDDVRELTDDELDDVAGGSGPAAAIQHLSQS